MSVQLHHVLDGPEDAPVVALSGSLGTRLEMWDRQHGPLTEHFRVLRYDQRGHGRSPAPEGPYSIADLAGDLVALLDQLELDRVSVCGVSLGGMTAMWLAANEPELVDRLVLCCTSAHMPPREDWIQRAATVRADGMAAVTEAALERWFTPRMDPDVVEDVRQQLLDTPAEGYAASCEAIADMDQRESLDSIQAPTLVISAEHDPSTPPPHGRLLADSIPDARFELVADARHLACMERHQTVTAAILRHLGAEVAA